LFSSLASSVPIIPLDPKMVCNIDGLLRRILKLSKDKAVGKLIAREVLL
jgi:hypothetical protein